jgi:tetratricopeptide (TPR) repeat protein
MPLNLRLQLRWLRWQSWLLLALGRRDAALRCFEAMLALVPGQPFALASRAHLRAQAGDSEAAAADLERLTTVQPDNAGHWFNLGFVRDAQGRHAEAVPAFEQATRLDAKLDRAWYGLGLALLQLGRTEEAIVALKRNTELQPMSPYGWTQLARAHARAEQPSRARKVVEHLRGFEPKVAEALVKELKLDASA